MSGDSECELHLVLYLDGPASDRHRLDVKASLLYRKRSFRPQNFVAKFELSGDGHLLGDSVKRQVAGNSSLILTLASLCGGDAGALENDLWVLRDFQNLVTHRALNLCAVALLDF